MPGVPAAVTGGTSRDKAAAGRGGDGLYTKITGSLVGTGGGGGGASEFSGYDYGPIQNTHAGFGGGGGGAGGAGGNATVNTGGGGGGGKYQTQSGGSGASGVVVLRIKTSQYSGTTTGSPTVTTVGDDTVLVYNASGTYVHS